LCLLIGLDYRSVVEEDELSTCSKHFGCKAPNPLGLGSSLY
jgi:hypothetical protein